MKQIILYIFTFVLTAGMLCSCQKNLFDKYNERPSQYDENWTYKYGEVPADQDWDFSDALEKATSEQDILPYPADLLTKSTSASGNAIASGETGAYDNSNVTAPLVISNLRYVDTYYQAYDRTWIKTVIADTPESDWTPNIIGEHDLWAWYAHVPDDDFHMYSLGVHWFDPTRGYPQKYDSASGEWVDDVDAGICGTEVYSDLPVLGYAYNSAWCYAGGNYTQKSTGTYGKRINTKGLEAENMQNIYWYVNDSAAEIDQENLPKLEKYKEIVTPSMAKYWCFDCNGDGDYTDLICLVDPAQREFSCKRYFIEDLGSTDDFDFNDIVVDVYNERSYKNVFDADGNVTIENGEWEQNAYIRAMGGSKDFTLTIGNTTWSKKGAGFNVGTLYNTPDPDYDAVLAKIPVTGWDKDTNNISLTVDNGSSDGIQTIAFPKKGTVPMIIAFSVNQKWQKERESIPAAWFTE